GLSGTITGASDASPIVITSANDGLVTGDVVTITGVTGNTAANGTWTITVIDANDFSLNGSTGNGTYATGGTWTSFSTWSIPVGSGTGDQFSGADFGIATDNNNLVQTTPASVTVNIDNPTSAITAPTNGTSYTNSGFPQITGTAT